MQTGRPSAVSKEQSEHARNPFPLKRHEPRLLRHGLLSPALLSPLNYQGFPGPNTDDPFLRMTPLPGSSGVGRAEEEQSAGTLRHCLRHRGGREIGARGDRARPC